MDTTDRYQHQSVEEKWRKAWKESALETPDILRATRPFYNLMMFPYPSAEGLHVGNMYAFTGSDIFGRFKRMQGYDVFEPIGLDGFGIHSENYALKIGRHPMDHAKITEKNYYNQLHKIGAMYDWTRTVETYDPSYYKWTQWLFVQMFKHGLAYRGKADVNWCPSCKTVLADEQVLPASAKASAGTCERCGNTVKKKQLEQWFFKITAYAEKLLQNSFSLDWAKKVKVAQQAWIGKKEGRKIKFGPIEVFTTRPDTIMGAMFVVLSPNHPLAGKVKTVVNPATKKTIPVFVDEYVLGTVGTGAIMGVPAYDERDKIFAKRMNLPIARAKLTKELFGKRMVTYHLRDWLISRQRYWGPPIPMIYCASCARQGRSWFTTPEAQSLMGNHKSQFPNPKQIQNQKSKSLDIGHWILDIPAQSAGWYPVPEKDLPVILPRIEDYKPGDDGVAPLAKHKEFYNVACPECGATARRETDVSDTFLDSSWYYLRYPSVTVGNHKSQFPNPKQIQNQKSKSLDIGHWILDIPWDRQITRKWLPVHMYTGGAEHSVLHLMYSRFITMALHDWGYIDFDEPFSTFYAHGLVIKDGSKMSKSKGNVVNPDEYIANYGADALRLYLMFTGPYDQGGDFRDSAMEGMSRWVQRVWRLVMSNVKCQMSNKKNVNTLYQHSTVSSATVKKALHRAIKKVGEDIERRRYNTAIAAMMELVNTVGDEGGVMGIEDLGNFLQILAPFAPYMTEELWQRILSSENQGTVHPRGGGIAAVGGKGHLGGESISQYTFTRSNSIHFQPWPAYDPKLLEEDDVRIAVQVNGKLRNTVVVSRQSSVVREEVEKESRASERVAKHLAGTTVKKVIFVPGKIINFVLQ